MCYFDKTTKTRLAPCEAFKLGRCAERVEVDDHLSQRRAVSTPAPSSGGCRTQLNVIKRKPRKESCVRHDKSSDILSTGRRHPRLSMGFTCGKVSRYLRRSRSESNTLKEDRSQHKALEKEQNEEHVKRIGLLHRLRKTIRLAKSTEVHGTHAGESVEALLQGDDHCAPSARVPFREPSDDEDTSPSLRANNAEHLDEKGEDLSPISDTSMNTVWETFLKPEELGNRISSAPASTDAETMLQDAARQYHLRSMIPVPRYQSLLALTRDASDPSLCASGSCSCGILSGSSTNHPCATSKGPIVIRRVPSHKVEINKPPSPVSEAAEIRSRASTGSRRSLCSRLSFRSTESPTLSKTPMRMKGFFEDISQAVPPNPHPPRSTFLPRILKPSQIPRATKVYNRQQPTIHELSRDSLKGQSTIQKPAEQSRIGPALSTADGKQRASLRNKL